MFDVKELVMTISKKQIWGIWIIAVVVAWLTLIVVFKITDSDDKYFADVGTYPFNDTNRVHVVYEKGTIVHSYDSAKVVVWGILENPLKAKEAQNVRKFRTMFIADCKTSRSSFKEPDFYDDFGKKMYSSDVNDMSVSPGPAGKDLFLLVCK